MARINCARLSVLVAGRLDISRDLAYELTRGTFQTMTGLIRDGHYIHLAAFGDFYTAGERGRNGVIMLKPKFVPLIIL